MKARNSLFFIIIALLAVLPYALSDSDSAQVDEKIENTPEYKVEKILIRPATVYTQGLFFDTTGKFLYESGGLYNESTIKKLKYPSLVVEKSVNLGKEYFAEGIAKCGNTVYQLTWQEKVILKYDLNSLEAEGKIPLDPKMREGWGLAEFNQETLIATDGSPNVYFLSCNENLKVVNSITITLNGVPLKNLNALVYAKGFIYANVYFDKRIYKIDPKSGNVVKTYYMSSLVDFERKKLTLTFNALTSGDVLNGIAYDAQRDMFLVTGKRWGYFYEVKFD